MQLMTMDVRQTMMERRTRATDQRLSNTNESLQKKEGDEEMSFGATISHHLLALYDIDRIDVITAAYTSSITTNKYRCNNKSLYLLQRE